MKTLSILLYNTCFNTDARDLKGFLKTHFYHYLGKTEKILKFDKSKETLKLIKKKNPDIVVLLEVLGAQMENLKASLKKEGYKSFIASKGHGWWKKEDVGLLIASKFKCNLLESAKLSLPVRPAYDGGFLPVILPDLKTLIVVVHLPIFKKAKQEYLREAAVIMKKHNCERVILVGDFNTPPEILKKIDAALFRDLEMLSPNQPTCTNVTFLNLFYSKCLDQIYGKGFKLVQNELIKSCSDHLAVYSKLKFI